MIYLKLISLWCTSPTPNYRHGQISPVLAGIPLSTWIAWCHCLEAFFYSEGWWLLFAASKRISLSPHLTLFGRWSPQSLCDVFWLSAHFLPSSAKSISNWTTWLGEPPRVNLAPANSLFGFLWKLSGACPPAFTRSKNTQERSWGLPLRASVLKKLFLLPETPWKPLPTNWLHPKCFWNFFFTRGLGVSVLNPI